MIELTLPDLSCGHCAAAVTRTVQALDPAATVKVDLPTKHVSIETALPPEQVRSALAEEGYPAA